VGATGGSGKRVSPRRDPAARHLDVEGPFSNAALADRAVPFRSTRRSKSWSPNSSSRRLRFQPRPGGSASSHRRPPYMRKDFVDRVSEQEAAVPNWGRMPRWIGMTSPFRQAKTCISRSPFQLQGREGTAIRDLSQDNRTRHSTRQWPPLRARKGGRQLPLFK